MEIDNFQKEFKKVFEKHYIAIPFLFVAIEVLRWADFGIFAGKLDQFQFIVTCVLPVSAYLAGLFIERLSARWRESHEKNVEEDHHV